MSARAATVRAADVIRAEMERGREVPEAFAVALESAQLLMSPETAAELERLRTERAALLALLPTKPLPHLMLGEGPALRAERAVWEQVAGVLGVELPKRPRPTVEVSADKLTRLLAPSQALREDDGYESPLRHDYRVGHDLPETGGAR